MKKPLTKAHAAEILEQARMDIALLMSQQTETSAQLHRLIGITGELYEGITGEEPEPLQIRAVLAS